ncbi:MAG: TetR/AcrR family transcriptional regulator [Candidatus Bipolaricaulota bacterium]|nr:TetR/AcrR family transcriptional regulator [Candidatus Bipolaricaulota bacterium]MDW8030349.1 TetR/AcrR family transcriptional regulator [Candidatus Bipolaricaulota bacterium]
MRDKELTRGRILDAAEKLFAQKGFHETAMEEIVRAAKVSKGGVYFHFPSKEALFFALLDKLADALQQEVQQEIARRRGAVNKIQGALEVVLRTLSGKRRLAQILLRQGYGLGPAFERKRLEIYSRFAQLIQKYLDEAAAEGSIPSINTEITAYAWLGAINELVLRWIYTGEPDPLTETLPALLEIFLRGIGIEYPHKSRLRKEPYDHAT